jgi:hypothetical protein
LRLRKETTMTLSWIGQQLNMGVKERLSHLFYSYGKDKKDYLTILRTDRPHSKRFSDFGRSATIQRGCFIVFS